MSPKRNMKMMEIASGRGSGRRKEKSELHEAIETGSRSAYIRHEIEDSTCTVVIASFHSHSVTVANPRLTLHENSLYHLSC